MSEKCTFNWDIHEIILDCLTNPNAPDFPQDFDSQEYDENTHGTIEEMPMAVRHLIMEETSHLLAIQHIEEEQFKASIDSRTWHAQEKLKHLLQNHLDTILDLEINLMLEVLVIKGLDVSNIVLVFLDDWKFTFMQELNEANPTVASTKPADTRFIH